MDTSINKVARQRDVGEFVRDEPLTALAIAAAAGFVLGGGVNRRLGLAILTTVGRIALQSAATSLIRGTGQSVATKTEDRTGPALKVKYVTTEEEISKQQDELNEARQDLRDTLTEVNAKVERAGRDLRPDHLVESYPVAACCVASALGFLLGANVKSRGTGPIVIAAMLGFALSIRSSREAG